MDQVFRFVTGRAWLMLALFIGLTGLALAQIVEFRTGRFLLEIDPSENRLLPEGDESKQFYDFVRKAFGNDETVLVAVHADDLFTAPALSVVDRLTTRLAEVDGVHHVTSLLNAVDIRGSEDGIEVGPFVSEVPDDPAELAEFRLRVLDNPVFAGNLVSTDGRTAAILIQFLNFSDREFINRGTDATIQQIVAEERGDTSVWITGGPHIKVAQVQYQLADWRRAMPLILLGLGLVLAISFRTVRGVALPLIAIVSALVWTMAIAGLRGDPLNLVTSLVPPLMLILGLSYAVHVLSAYSECAREDPDASSAETAHRAVMLVAQPVILTAITTAAGFLALALSPIGAISEFGVLAMIGIGASTFASLFLVPTLLSVLPMHRRLERPESGPMERAARALGEFNLQNRKAILFASGGIFALSVVAAFQLEVGGNSIEAFPEDSSVRLDFYATNEHLEGANPFNIVLAADKDDAFQEPENLRVVESFQLWLEDQPEIGGTTSVVDFIKLINRGFHENQPEYLAIPETRRLTAQLLFFGSSDDLMRFLDGRRRLLNIEVRANVIDRSVVNDLVERIEARMTEFPEHITGRVTGNPILKNRLAGAISRGQALSMFTALVFIYAILIVFFLDWRTALMALLPNALVIVFFFGLLGASGVTLNLATSIIGPMALGIAVDDTIHYFVRFTQDAKRFADERRAMGSALIAVGRPVTYTTIAICTGFLMLTTSDLTPQVQVGLLGAVTLAFAWLIDVTLTPVLCSGLRVVTLWDTLALDLGDRPQESIQLFAGLSKAQCRIVALMASLRHFPAGHRLMHAGEEGKELFVIIDGMVEASVERDGGRVMLRQQGRGESVGVVGIFKQQRSANVDVIEDARVLRLTQKNMQRLSRRYPRTAARVFRNLGESLAGLLADTTSRLG
jgi:hydrophobe/amphiphile efflux-3 (HAE3) family protein